MVVKNMLFSVWRRCGPHAGYANKMRPLKYSLCPILLVYWQRKTLIFCLELTMITAHCDCLVPPYKYAYFLHCVPKK